MPATAITMVTVALEVAGDAKTDAKLELRVEAIRDTPLET